MDLFARRRQELQERKDQTRAWIVAGVLLLLILALLGFLYAGVTQDRDYLRGDELYEKQKFREAIGYYLRSEQQSSWTNRPGLIYRIATCYERLQQYPRAGDYFIKLGLENPGTDWKVKAEEGMRRVFQGVNHSGDLDRPGTPGGTPLVQAKQDWHRNYQRLMLAMDSNRSGVSAELEQAYQEYKRSYETYVREIEQGLRRLDSEGI